MSGLGRVSSTVLSTHLLIEVMEHLEGLEHFEECMHRLPSDTRKLEGLIVVLIVPSG